MPTWCPMTRRRKPLSLTLPTLRSMLEGQGSKHTTDWAIEFYLFCESKQPLAASS
ncbi:hypothetical protein IG631_20291 [Alternaria alternata]|nr:hypothetical protein IG631_20291 [Alternaria alternata]